MFTALRRIGADRIAMTLSGLCLVHCISGLLLVTVFAVVGGELVDPLIHEIGFALAIVLAIFALGRGWALHRRQLPLALGAMGVSLMAAGIMVPHGDYREVALTMGGVGLVALAHWLNRRSLA